MHRSEILCDGTIVCVAEFCLVAFIAKEQIINLHLIDIRFTLSLIYCLWWEWWASQTVHVVSFI